MCGIAGIISRNPANINSQKVQSATSCLGHRGPDNENTWINPSGTIALGHRRLAIIDPGPLASQPMHYRELTIVHNGEIYNYIEIRNQLMAKGHIFKTRSDTEVILAAFSEWGSRCLQHFDGMFSFVIWDDQKQKLFAARDRFGEKPFFFFYNDEQFVFSSEQKTLWTLGLPRIVNSAMLYNFLSIGYTSNPGNPQETFYTHVNKLPAASFLKYDLTTSQIQIEQYWKVEQDIITISEDEAIEKFEELFEKSIQKRLRSDVAIGTSLSGGLDSSAIIAFCNRFSSNQFTHKCFTAAFSNSEMNELPFASTVAEKYSMQQHILDIDDQDIVSTMDEVMHYQEEPFSSSSVIAQYKIFKFARQNGVTVLLDGQGADEVLGGYHHYYKWYWQELYRNKKLQSGRELKAAREKGIKEPFTFKNKLAALFPEFAAAMLQSRKSIKASRHPDLSGEFAFEQKRNLYYSTPTTPGLNGALYFNTFVSGLEELLRIADRNSMAHATEIRLPFLQYELVEFLFSLPPYFKIRDGWTKWILRKSVENDLPASIAWRKDKKGFEPPQKKWMENPEVKNAILDGKKKLVQAGVLNKSALKNIKPHSAYAADARDWRYWSASYLF